MNKAQEISLILLSLSTKRRTKDICSLLEQSAASSAIIIYIKFALFNFRKMESDITSPHNYVGCIFIVIFEMLLKCFSPPRTR